VDTVNLKDGNLHVNIPLFTLPGRELPVSVSMDYNSQFYESRVIYPPDQDPVTYYEFMGWRKNTGVGGGLSASMAQHTPYYDSPFQTWRQDVDLTFTWIEWNGAKHNFTQQVSRTCRFGDY